MFVRGLRRVCPACPSWVGLAGSAGSPSWHGGSSQPRWNHLTNTHKWILEAFSKLNPSVSVSCSCKGSCAVSLVHPGPELQVPIALGSAAQLYSSLPRCLGCSRGRTHPSVAWWVSAEPRSVPAVHRLQQESLASPTSHLPCPSLLSKALPCPLTQPGSAAPGFVPDLSPRECDSSCQSHLFLQLLLPNAVWE